MGGCDIVDFMNANYKIRTKTIKWTIRFGDWIITTAGTNASNAYIIYIKTLFGDPGLSRRDSLEIMSDWMLDELFLRKYYQFKARNFSHISREKREDMQAVYELIRQNSKEEFQKTSDYRGFSLEQAWNNLDSQRLLAEIDNMDGTSNDLMPVDPTPTSRKVDEKELPSRIPKKKMSKPKDVCGKCAVPTKGSKGKRDRNTYAQQCLKCIDRNTNLSTVICPTHTSIMCFQCYERLSQYSAFESSN